MCEGKKSDMSRCDFIGNPAQQRRGDLKCLCPLSNHLFTKWVDEPFINFPFVRVFLLQWVGSSCGLHGPYIFYKAFKYNQDGKTTILSLGDFFFVRCKPEDPICVAELQLLWEERTSKQLLSSSKLYFLPEDTPQGRTVTHGEVGHNGEHKSWCLSSQLCWTFSAVDVCCALFNACTDARGCSGRWMCCSPVSSPASFSALLSRWMCTCPAAAAPCGVNCVIRRKIRRNPASCSVISFLGKACLTLTYGRKLRNGNECKGSTWLISALR